MSTVYLLQYQASIDRDYNFMSWNEAVWTDLNACSAFIANYFDVEYPKLERIGDTPRIWLSRGPKTSVTFRIIECEIQPTLDCPTLDEALQDAAS